MFKFTTYNFTTAAMVSMVATAGVLATNAGEKSEIRFSGNATFASSVVTPCKDAVEKATGSKIFVVTSNSGKGMVDLAAGNCEAAMVSEPLEKAVEAAKVVKSDFSADGLKFHQIATQEIKFVVHPSNGVKSLTWAQIKDIHTGRVTNWKDVGGADAPIVVFIGPQAAGTRANIKSAVLGGDEYGAQCKTVDTMKRVATSVADTPGGIGGVGATFIDAKQVKAVETQKLESPLGVVTKGEPSEGVAKVIEAFRAEMGKAKK